MKLNWVTTLILCFGWLGCEQTHQTTFEDILSDSPSINGKSTYLSSPFVAAGNRVYMVGHQDGSFPELGWHITGEMGGIWNHPIKLMDGFDVIFTIDEKTYQLNNASKFTNYPYANAHHFDINEKELEITRFQFAPDHQQGIVIQYSVKNTGKTEKIIDVPGSALAGCEVGVRI